MYIVFVYCMCILYGNIVWDICVFIGVLYLYIVWVWECITCASFTDRLWKNSGRLLWYVGDVDMWWRGYFDMWLCAVVEMW